MTPAVMPRRRLPRNLGYLLNHPGLVLAWSGGNVTLRVHDQELTLRAAEHPRIIERIRRYG